MIFQCQIFAQNLKVCDNNRFIVEQDGTQFFWLGYTGWLLFQRLNKEETDYCIKDRLWENAINYPGSFLMRKLKKLMLSRPYLSRIPDQSINKLKASTGVDHLQATRDGTLGEKDATYIMVYFPYLTHKHKIRTDVINAKKLHV